MLFKYEEQRTRAAMEYAVRVGLYATVGSEDAGLVDNVI